MTEEPYRWLEAIENRREYILDQIKEGSPTFAVSLPDGILLLGVGAGNSKVFEIHDRHAMAGLGHPADLERLRQAVIDAAHVEAFTRAAEDVSLRRLVAFGLGPQLKAGFEQIFSAPFLAELIFAEVGSAPPQDVLVRLRFDGTFHFATTGILVASATPAVEKAATEWLKGALEGKSTPEAVAKVLLEAWWCLVEKKPFDAAIPDQATRTSGWQIALGSPGRTVEAGWLDRHAKRPARYRSLRLAL